MGFRAKRAAQLIDIQLNENKKINMEYTEKMQCDVHDLSSKEFIGNILNKIDLFKIIENHNIELPKWIQFTFNAVMPKKSEVVKK